MSIPSSIEKELSPRTCPAQYIHLYATWLPADVVDRYPFFLEPPPRPDTYRGTGVRDVRAKGKLCIGVPVGATPPSASAAKHTALLAPKGSECDSGH